MASEKTSRLLDSIGFGSVVMYKDPGAIYATYLVVQKVEDGIVHGEMAAPIGVNEISLEELAKKEGLSIAEFKPFKSQ